MENGLDFEKGAPTRGGFIRRTWAEIDLDAVAANYNAICRQIDAHSQMMCVVKADAYGHGVGHVARRLQAAGAPWFAVSNIEEAMQLRACGIEGSILILGYTPPESAPLLARYDIAQAVFSERYARALSQEAVRAEAVLRVHIKLDTGMSRIGFFFQEEARDLEALQQVAEACQLEGLQVEGIFTHFAVADEGEEGRAYTLRQFTAFTSALRLLEEKGISFAYRHCCNSGGILSYPEMNLDLVRPGIILYGLLPSQKLRGVLPLQPVMQLRTVISQLKEVPAGVSVSYGREFTTRRPTVLATVPIGYADGYPRSMAGRADMLVNGRRAPVVGRVCMDQVMLDVTGIDGVREGMTVTVFGRDGGQELPLDELASIAGTINYEMACEVTKRVPRIYFEGGRAVGQLNYILPE